MNEEMDFLNSEVMHKAFGAGKLVTWDDASVTVSFADGEKTFVYPDAFQGFLTTKDPALKQQIKADIRASEAETREHQNMEKEKEAALQLRRDLNEQARQKPTAKKAAPRAKRVAIK